MKIPTKNSNHKSFDLVLFINGSHLHSSFPSRYHVSGVIQLPYAEINEPFESWINVELGFSRVDYYGGEFSFSF